MRCTRAGWTCDGYTTDKGTSIAHKAGKVAAPAVPGSAFSIGRYAIPFRVPGSQRDRQILHYFCVQGAHEIASYFNIDFWTTTVLQQSHEESAVRQALVSLSALHLEYTSTAVPGSDYTKHGALAQYGRAIHALRRRIEKSDHNTVKTALTCCILFYCFEAALGHSAAAMRHLDSGLHLLSTRHRRELDDIDDMKRLSRILESLDLQATLFDDSRSLRLLLSNEVLRDTAAFQCLDEACWAFTRLQNSVFRFLITQNPNETRGKDILPSSTTEEKRLLRQLLDSWLARFERSGFGQDRGEHDYAGARILLVQWNVSDMCFEAICSADDSVFGASPNPRAEKILDMVHDVLDHSQVGEKEGNQDPAMQRRTFSSESGIVSPLFALAAKCSDETVCDRALEMLNRSRRREGLYDAGSMVEVIHQFRTAE